jgi:uncharacterized protein YacL
MKLLSIASAVVWVDFLTIILSKFFHLGRSLDKWYKEFGVVAVLSDCLVIVLGVLLALILHPNYTLFGLIFAVIAIQLVHDILLFKFVIQPLPLGHNKIIDLFKEYAAENSWKILVADSLMIGSTVLLANYLDSFSFLHSSFIGLLGVYGLSYIIYTE